MSINGVIDPLSVEGQKPELRSQSGREVGLKKCELGVPYWKNGYSDTAWTIRLKRRPLVLRALGYPERREFAG